MQGDPVVDARWGMAQLWAAAAIFMLLSHEKNRVVFDANESNLRSLAEILHRDCTRGEHAARLQVETLKP
eukprot:95748-Prorocentrum_minimum.AAC.2